MWRKYFLVIVAVSLFVRCQNGPLDPVVEPESVAITASANGGASIDPSGTKSFIVGATALYNLNFTQGYGLKSLTIDGIKQSKENINLLIQNNILSFKVSKSQEILIEGATNNFLLITDGADDLTNPWYLKSIEYYDVNGQYEYTLDIHDSRLTEKTYYKSDNHYTVIDENGKSVVTNADWKEDGNTFTYSNLACSIVELSEKVFSYQRLIVQSGHPDEYMRINMYRK